jgi:hypothetical protein
MRYEDCEDGYYIAASPDVYGISNEVGEIFFAADDNWAGRTMPCWPTSFRRHMETMVLGSEHWGPGQMIPLTRRLVLDYIGQRVEHPGVHVVPRGDLMVPMRDREGAVAGDLYVVTERNTAVAPLRQVDEPGRRTRGWFYDSWQRITPDEAEALADFAAHWWASGGDPSKQPEAGLVTLPEGTSFEDRHGGFTVVSSAMEREPDTSRATVETTEVDGFLVRVERTQLRDRPVTRTWVDQSWAKAVAEYYAETNGQQVSLERLLNGERMGDGSSFAALPRLERDGRVFLDLDAFERLKDLAADRYSWCGTANRVITDLRDGRRRPTGLTLVLTRPMAQHRDRLEGVTDCRWDGVGGATTCRVTVSTLDELAGRELAVRQAEHRTGLTGGWVVDSVRVALV